VVEEGSRRTHFLLNTGVANISELRLERAYRENHSAPCITVSVVVVDGVGVGGGDSSTGTTTRLLLLSLLLIERLQSVQNAAARLITYWHQPVLKL